MHSVDTSEQWQEISIISQSTYGQLYFNSNRFFFVGTEATVYTLHMYLVTFGNTAVDWAKQMICPSGTWGTNWSGSWLSSDSTKIYSMYIYGSTRYLYFVTFNVADGAIVGNRYKSSISCVLQYLLVLNGNYLLALPLWTQKFMLLYNINTNTFTMKQFSGSNIFNIGIEASTGRLVNICFLNYNNFLKYFFLIYSLGT